MKKTTLYVLVVIGLFSFSLSIQRNNCVREKVSHFFKSHSYTSYVDTISGDFNGDSEKEEAWIKKTSKDNLGELGIKNRCTVLFSDEKVKILDTEVYCLFGNLWNVGDLDNDNADELALVLFSEREWSQCFVFSFKKRGWYLMTEPFLLWGGIEDRKVQKDPDNKGHILIRELTIKNDSIQPQTRSVKIY